MNISDLPSWLQNQVAELEAQINRKLTEQDWESLDVHESAETLTVSGDPLLSEIRMQEQSRFRGLDLPPNP